MKLLPFFFLLFTFSIRAQTLFEKGVRYYNMQQYDVANGFFEKLLQSNSEDLRSIEYLGDIQSHQLHWEKAVLYYEKLKAHNSTNAEYQYKYGGALAMLSQNVNVIAALRNVGLIKSALEKAIVLNPQHIGARWILIELYLQLPALLGGSEKTAVTYSNELLKLSPVDGYLAKGRIAEFYKRYPSAEKNYLKAIEIGNSQITYQKLAELYKNKLNQPAKARLLLAASNEKNKS